MNVRLETNGKTSLKNLFVRVTKGDNFRFTLPVHTALQFNRRENNRIVFEDGTTKRIKVTSKNEFGAHSGFMTKTITGVLIEDQ